jgi:NADH-quinone oxidoreductase subunit J
MSVAFIILSIITIVGGLAAIRLKNIVHCALALIAFFAGVAGIFFSLHAEFIGAVQIIVYIGAVAVLLLFAIMLTRHVTGVDSASPFTAGAGWGNLVGLVTFAVLFYSIYDVSFPASPTASSLSVADLGRALMTRYGVPFEVISLLLTAALVGAVVIALEEPKPKGDNK